MKGKSKIKRSIWWAYLGFLHIIVLLVFLAIPEIRNRFRAETRTPGSVIYSSYDDYPDGGWVRVIGHDGRDPILGVIENNGWIDHMFVSPPDTPFVWYFNREQDQPWTIMIAEFESESLAGRHLKDPTNFHLIMDGQPYGILDGFPDRELVLEDGLKKFYKIETIERTLDNEVPDNTSP